MNDETDMPMPMSDGEMSGDKPDTKPSKAWGERSCYQPQSR